MCYYSHDAKGGGFMNLEALLDERNMNKRQFAMMADVPYTTVYEVISGKRSLEKLTAGNALRIAHALGMSVEELLNDEPPKLSADEAELLAVYRSLPTFAQKMAMAMVRNIAEGLSDD